jgi:sporulation protein YlmC with PRC-barrel domain
MTKHKKHLYYMNELSDYKISDGFPDVRGWDVKDIDDRVIGKVDNLLVNIDSQRVVYLDVEVDKTIIDANHDPYGRPRHIEVREFVNKDGDNHIIIPIGLVDFNDDSNYVYTDVIDHKTFAETKRIRKGDTIGRDYEVQVMDSYGRRIDYDRKDRDLDDRDLVYDDVPNEAHIREIIRDEIYKFHNRRKPVRDRIYADNVDDAVIVSEEELERKRRNDDAYDDDYFYDRRAFDNSRFKRRRTRTPGL